MSSPLLTVAIPVFERKEFFVQAVESVRKQSEPCQLLVVDNASSHTFFKDYCDTHGIRYFRNETNIGMFANWNKCFELATTDFVMLLGDDDLLSPTYVEAFVSAVANYPAIDVFFTDFFQLVNETGELKNHPHKLPFGFVPVGNQVFYEFAVKHGLGFPVITSAIRKSKFGGFYTAAHASNDWHWAYSNLKEFSVYGEIKKLVSYRSHAKQDHVKGPTHLMCILSMAYIYEQLLPKALENNRTLAKRSVRKSSDALAYFFSKVSPDLLNSILEKGDIYADYVKHKLANNWGFSMYAKLPLTLRTKIYSLSRRMSLRQSI